MSCNIEDKTVLEKAQDYVDCPNSMVPQHERDAMIIAALLEIVRKLPEPEATP
jgi:hypothetical protein